MSPLGTIDSDDAALTALFPSMTSILILATFLMTVFQLYKYVKRMMNTKVDYEGF